MGKKDIAYLDQLLLKTKGYIERIDDSIAQELNRYSDSRFYEPLNYAMKDGKRIRPIVLLVASEVVGGDAESALEASVAVELLHAESLIHDDIIDQEVSRRGKEAFHIKYGYNESLLTADFVFAMILAIAARYKDRRVAKTLSTAALRMCEGEQAEADIGLKKTIDWEEYTSIIFNKTASLFQTATRLGGLIGGGTKEQVETLSNYGKYVGIAYQIHDDTLDFGSTDKLTAVLERKGGDDLILSQLSKMSERYVKKAKTELATLPDSNAKRLLADLTDFTVQRES